ncbi:RES family NAD+ phosphorylase [Rhodanobacter sp. UC4436_H3]
MPPSLPPVKRIRWSHAFRIVPSRFPPVGVYDRIAAPADIDALFAVEALTNPRLREEADALKLVPKEHRISGPGSTPVMAAFTHLNLEGSRFSDGTWGVFYAAHSVATAVEETVYHRERFLAATAEPPCSIQMRCYRTSVDSRLHDIRGGWKAEHDPDAYVASVKLARTLRDDGSNGIVYDSARHPGGECLAAFQPDVVAPCVQSQHLVYRWDGSRIAQVLEVSELSRPQAVGTARSNPADGSAP